MDRDHELNMQQLQNGFIQLEDNNNDKEKRGAQIMRFHKKIPLTLNIGAFIRKAIRNGWSMSTYWTYKGSCTTPVLRDCKKYDVGFILDESGSIPDEDWLKTKDFTKAP